MIQSLFLFIYQFILILNQEFYIFNKNIRAADHWDQPFLASRSLNFKKAAVFI